MTATAERDPFTPSPAALVRNEHLRKVLAYIDVEATSDAHARRARVRVASCHPPTGPLPTAEDVDRALADTAPAEETDQP